MATTIHIPAELLKTVDKEAKRKRVSRNKYIVEALTARLAAESGDGGWPAQFFDDMRGWREDPDHQRAMTALKKVLGTRRRNKRPLAL